MNSNARRLLLAIALCTAVIGIAGRWSQAGIINPLAWPHAYDLPAKNAEVEKAEERFRNGDYESALRLLEEVVKLHPELPPARFLLAKLFLAANQLPQARNLLEQVAATSPAEPDVHLVLGHLAFLDQRFSDCQLQFEKAATLVSVKSWKPDRKAKCNTICFNGLALAAEARGNWDQAARHLKSLLALPGEAEQMAAYRQRLGRAMFQLGQTQAAVEELQRAALENPKLDPAAVILARLYLDQRKAKEAEQWLIAGLKSHPNCSRTRLAYATWLLDAGRLSEAETHATTLTAALPQSLDVKFLCGLIAWRARQPDKAERIFEDVHRDSPAHFEASNLLALALAEQSDETKRRRAVQLAENNVRQNSQAAGAYAALGQVYYRANRLAEAENAFRIAATNGQLSSDSAYFLASAMLAPGNQGKLREQARVLLEGALKADGPFVFRKECQAALATLDQKSIKE